MIHSLLDVRGVVAHDAVVLAAVAVAAEDALAVAGNRDLLSPLRCGMRSRWLERLHGKRRRGRDANSRTAASTVTWKRNERLNPSAILAVSTKELRRRRRRMWKGKMILVAAKDGVV